MNRVDVLLTSEPEDGIAPFSHGELEVVFHNWQRVGDLPLIDGVLWAFVDLVLPEISGLEVCRRLRCDPLTAQAHITVILDEPDADLRKRVLRAGADDYLLAPVTRAAILDRVMAARPTDFDPNALSTIVAGELSVDVAAFQARFRGKIVPLMPNEFRLLRYFAAHPNRVFTRSQLIAALGKEGMHVDERTVDVWVGRLRRALRAAGGGELLRTARSLGYVLDTP
jgi:two-component system, OmpR family, phosphate regulon response regulator PhoB